MPSAIDVTVPGTNSALVSANVRTNFSTAAGEISALQTSISALQTKTTVSGDGSLGTTGALTVTALQGRAVATTAPTANQVLAWSGTQWVPTPATGGIAEPTPGTTIYGRGGTPTPAWTPVLPLSGGTLTGDLTANNLISNNGVQINDITVGNPQWSVYAWNGALHLDTATTTGTHFSLYADGAIVVGDATGGKQAPGVINAAGFSVNGVPVGTGAGSVSSVTAGTGLATTPAAGISTTGSIALATVGTAGGPFTNATVTVDAYGRVTAAAAGAAGAGSSSALATNTGKFYVNLNATPTIQASGAAVQVTGTDAAADASTTVVIDAVVQPIIRTRKAMTSMAATVAGGGALPAFNAALFLLDMQGHNGNPNGFSSGAQIRAAAAGAWIQGNNYPTRMEFWTTRLGAGNVAPQAAMTITGTGGVVLGGAPDQGVGSISAEEVFAQGQNVMTLIDALDARLTALGG